MVNFISSTQSTKATPTVRSGSAPPIRGYEKPIPLPSDERHSAQAIRVTSGTLQQHLPPRNPNRNNGVAATTSKFVSSYLSTKKRRVPQRKPLDNLQDGDILAGQCSLAMSRTESIMVSAAGDVIVCRCRRSSTPFIPVKARDQIEALNRQFPCCDTELLSSIEGPWSPVLENLTTHRGPRLNVSSSSHTIASEFSTYEWERKNGGGKVENRHVLGKVGNGLKGGSGRDNNNIKSFSFVKEDTDRSRQKASNTLSGPRVTIDVMDDIDENTDQITEPVTDGRDAERKDDVEDSSSSGSIWGSSIGDLLLSLPSFDYSHIHEGHNDMVPPVGKSDHHHYNKDDKSNTPSTNNEKYRRQKQPYQQPSLFYTIIDSPEEKKDMDPVDKDIVQDHQPRFMHGVPVFLSALSQVRITKVSAHPLGAHVLMISAEALLFTYGLNHHGQLGIGIKSEIKHPSRGFHITPTLVTPLLENGGKAINCAAGVDHSLVVVATEGRRLQKLQTKPGVAYSDHGAESLRVPNSPCETSTGSSTRHHPVAEKEVDERFHFSEKSVQYHQVYAFGRNNFMKLGLIRPHAQKGSEPGNAEDSVLPRRVALHCTVWPQEGHWMDSSFPTQGIFDIAASAEHSAALVRRATGDVEVYMWGNASLGALGLPLKIDSQEIRGEIARKPYFKKSNISPLPSIVEALSYKRNGNPQAPFATQLSLGPYSSFIVMSNGKCMSCGFSAEGMLGQGYHLTHTMEPKEVFLSPKTKSDSISHRRIISVSAGAFHVLALTEDGKAYSWGINSNDRLGLGAVDYSTVPFDSTEKKEDLVVIEWVPHEIDLSHKVSTASRNCGEDNNDQSTKARIALVCAGYDSSMMVTSAGQVLSFGKKSGRLGKGEILSNVNTPQPMYGGLHLFQDRKGGATRRPKRVGQSNEQG
jgi:alpha-tubulin suppressor-like RCC1 family protein